MGHFAIHSALTRLPAVVWTPTYQARQTKIAVQPLRKIEASLHAVRGCAGDVPCTGR